METGESRTWSLARIAPGWVIPWIAGVASLAPAQDKPTPEDDRRLITIHRVYSGRAEGRNRMEHREAANAIAIGLAWLARHQDASGRWSPNGFMIHDDAKSPRCDGAGQPGQDVGITGLALLAFLADGHTTVSGTYQGTVVVATKWLQKQQAGNGRFGTENRGDFIYGHAIATYAMVEVAGLSGDPKLCECARRALAFLENHRNPVGVWRYAPRSQYGDTSITAWCLSAYCAARDLGFPIDGSALRIAANYLDEVTDSDSGRCGYSRRGETSARLPGDHGVRFRVEKTEALTAAALLCRSMLGQHPDRAPVMKSAASTISARAPHWDGTGGIDLYYWYYASHALRQVGGTHWKRWYTALTAALVPNQRKNANFSGSWDPVGAWCEVGGRVYATAMATLALQAEYRYGTAAFDPTRMPDLPRLAQVQAAWTSRDFAQVEKELARLRAAEVSATLSKLEAAAVRVAAATWQAEIEGRCQEVEDCRKGPDFVKARARLDEIEKQYQGLPPAEKAKEMTRLFRTDPKIRREIRAAEVLARFPERPARTRAARLKRFIEQFEGTYAARKAAERLNPRPRR